MKELILLNIEHFYLHLASFCVISKYETTRFHMVKSHHNLQYPSYSSTQNKNWSKIEILNFFTHNWPHFAYSCHPDRKLVVVK